MKGIEEPQAGRSTAKIIADTGALNGAGSSTAADQLADIVHLHSEELVARFYDVFLSHDEAMVFLEHGVVQERLGRSLQNWLCELFPRHGANNLEEIIERQQKIGEVHARIRIPIHLVMEGAEQLKKGLTSRVVERNLSPSLTVEALILMHERIDLAMRMMGSAYMNWTARKVRVDEAYRIFSIGQDVSVERESQRASLMEWSQTALFNIVGAGESGEPAGIAKSSFGLWFRHRAGVIFQGAPNLDQISRRMREIDDKILPDFVARRAQGDGIDAPLARFQEAIEEIKYLLADLFKSVNGLESGIDPLTRALNRRFMPSILGREISLAREAGSSFSVLMIDIDHFKSINDGHGHAAGDLVLRDLAGIIVDNIRISDFLFRYGGEEFLIALVETPGHDAQRIAERIRTQFEAQRVRLTDDSELQATISVGVATFDGHPDYDYLIRAADAALYRAKSSGRNRTVTVEQG